MRPVLVVGLVDGGCEEAGGVASMPCTTRWQTVIVSAGLLLTHGSPATATIHNAHGLTVDLDGAALDPVDASRSGPS